MPECSTASGTPSRLRNRLRRQADLGHQHQCLRAARQRLFYGAQIDLGLAAAGDAVQQERRVGAQRGADRVYGLPLSLVQGRAGFRSRGSARRGRRQFLVGLQYAAFDQRPGDGAGRAAQRIELAVAETVPAARQVDDGALFGAEPRRSCRARIQPPARLAGVQCPALAQQHRQGGRVGLTERVLVIVGRELQQLDRGRVEQRLAVHDACGVPELAGRYVAGRADPR